jgi:UDP-N-acetylmuramyl pentapeptide phosphotransferase/UDP-N-acetylglucosamine-1-phosphate transferase
MAGQGGVIGVAAALASAACTAGWIAWARQRNVVDAPGQRRLHATATPRGGGIGMAVVALALLAMQAWGGSDPVEGAAALFAGVACAAGIGLLDDLYAPSSAIKLLGQALAAAAIAWALPWPTAHLAGHAIAFAWVLVLVNFWNFMDGSNGIVALQTLVVSAVLAVMLGGSGAGGIAIGLAAACLGFLPFNLPRARVFMGDTGSHVLGAMVAILTLCALREGRANPGQVLILLSAFLLDAGLTLAKRIVQGRRFWRAHREHLYQWAVRRGHSHARVCLAYAAWAILAALVALGWAARGATEGAVGALAVGLAGTATWVVLRRHWLRRDTRMDAPT